MSWFLAPSLAQLRDEVNARWPRRDKASDGAVGDTSHQAGKSSHNPDWDAPGQWAGVVRGLDIDNNGKPGQNTALVTAVREAAIGDPRVWYVIWNGRIWSRTHGWKPRPYNGANPHDKHVHISLREEIPAWSNTARWLEATVNYKPFDKADALFWNMNNGKRPGVEQALDALNASGARLLNLNECGGHWPILRDFAGDEGFSIYTGEGDIGSSSAILVRHGSGHTAGGVRTIDVPWIGPKGKRIAGRPLVFEKAVVDDRRILTVDIHQVWGPNRESNDDAKRRVSEAVRRWAAMNPGWDIYVGADHNESRASREPFSPLGNANSIGGRILAGGDGGDFIYYRPATRPTKAMAARPATPRVSVGDKYDSDHHALGVTY